MKNNQKTIKMHPARTQNNQKTIKKQSKSTQNNQKTIKTPLSRVPRPARGGWGGGCPRPGRGVLIKFHCFSNVFQCFFNVFFNLFPIFPYYWSGPRIIEGFRVHFRKIDEKTIKFDQNPPFLGPPAGPAGCPRPREGGFDMFDLFSDFFLIFWPVAPPGDLIFDFILIFSSAWQICLIFVWFVLWFFWGVLKIVNLYRSAHERSLNP